MENRPSKERTSKRKRLREEDQQKRGGRAFPRCFRVQKYSAQTNRGGKVPRAVKSNESEIHHKGNPRKNKVWEIQGLIFAAEKWGALYVLFWTEQTGKGGPVPSPWGKRDGAAPNVRHPPGPQFTNKGIGGNRVVICHWQRRVPSKGRTKNQVEVAIR